MARNFCFLPFLSPVAVVEENFERYDGHAFLGDLVLQLPDLALKDRAAMVKAGKPAGELAQLRGRNSKPHKRTCLRGHLETL